MLYYVPIEPYKTRYTADWIEQFETEFRNYGVPFVTILGTSVSDTVTSGGVLDTCGTHIYKFSQITKLMSLIKDGAVNSGDIIFFADLWFPGLESLFYVRNMTNIDFKICGIFHAGTYDAADFTYRNGMRSWGKYLENSWFTELDTIFVATDFHKELILKNLYHIENISDIHRKIHVTGLPFYGKQLHDKYISNKQDILVFPHRLDAEKHPELFDSLVKYLHENNVNVKAVRTIAETSSRDEYFRLLGKSKVMVSFADQETFGYSTLESMALDNIVVVPDRLSYKETVPVSSRYSTIKQAFDMVRDALLNYSTPNYEVEVWASSIRKMLEIIKVA